MKIVGHRGARGLAPENTIAGLKKGLEHHVDALEFDLRVTKDKIVVLHHNQSVVDSSGKRFFIRSADYRTLKKHKPDLTTFDEVLQAIPKGTPLFIEVKTWVDTKPIISLIRDSFKHGWKLSDMTLRSFSYITLKKLHRALPDVHINILERFSGVRATSRARRMHTKSLTMKQQFLWFGFIKAISRNGYQLYAYTINDPVKAKRWEQYGLYGIVTDFPDRFEKR
ncbi:MAG TPA: glycerophosphodiester phosphodiesterase [Candidatus Saccharimonadales bacterium]|nr:glycerophosphodiester phosphodiesterase [Candidatus Saccharimonadales bacterium]